MRLCSFQYRGNRTAGTKKLDVYMADQNPEWGRVNSLAGKMAS